MGVCRGKISEGIDFKDDCCRAVIICGLPYGNVYDSKIIFKKEFLDNFNYEINDGSSSTSSIIPSKGNKWYNEEAMRSINQSIGRVIRHKNDYGAIFFLDSRFSNNQRIKEISKWVRTHFRIYRDIEQIQSDIDKFFELFKGLSDRNLEEIKRNFTSNQEKEGTEKSPAKEIGKNFQECYIKNEKTNKNKHEIPQNKFIFNPTKKIKNQPKILSMIQNITKGKNQEKNIYTDNKEQSIFETKDDKDNIKLDNAKSLIASFRNILSKDIYDKFFEVIKETKKKSNENKYEILINNIIELIIQNFVEANKQQNEGIAENNSNDILSDIMNEKQLVDVWRMLIKLINNFFPVQEKEKCFFILQKIFKEKTNDFDELEKYVYNYRLEKIEII